MEKTAEDYAGKLERTLEKGDFSKHQKAIEALNILLNERGRASVFEDELSEALKEAGASGSMDYVKSILAVMDYRVLPRAKQNSNDVAKNEYYGIAKEDNLKTIKRLGKRLGFKRVLEAKKNLTVPEKHQLNVAEKTLKMPDAIVNVMGGMTKDEAREVIERLTGKKPRGSKERISAYITQPYPSNVPVDAFEIGDRVIKIVGTGVTSNYEGKIADLMHTAQQVLVVWPWSIEYEDPSFLINLTKGGWSPNDRDRNPIQILSGKKKAEDTMDKDKEEEQTLEELDKYKPLNLEASEKKMAAEKIDESNFGLDVDTETGEVEYRLGNWTDAGWHWSGDSSDQMFGLYLFRIANSKIRNEFLTKFKTLSPEAKDACNKLLMSDFLTDTGLEEIAYSLTGDNACHHFGQCFWDRTESSDEIADLLVDTYDLAEHLGLKQSQITGAVSEYYWAKGGSSYTQETYEKALPELKDLIKENLGATAHDVVVFINAADRMREGVEMDVLELMSDTQLELISQNVDIDPEALGEVMAKELGKDDEETEKLVEALSDYFTYGNWKRNQLKLF